MSILDTVQPGKVLDQIGAYDLPTADEAIERINQSFVMTLTIENLLLSVDSVLVKLMR